MTQNAEIRGGQLRMWFGSQIVYTGTVRTVLLSRTFSDASLVELHDGAIWLVG